MTSQPMTPGKRNSRTRELGDSCGAKPLTCNDADLNPLASTDAAQGWGVTPPSRPADDPGREDSQFGDLKSLQNAFAEVSSGSDLLRAEEWVFLFLRGEVAAAVAVERSGPALRPSAVLAAVMSLLADERLMLVPLGDTDEEN